MKLILEDENRVLESEIVESVNEATGTKKKEYFLSGVFSTAGVKNGNGRVYPRHIWEREVAAYQDKINENHIHTLGEWEHPARADVDPMKAVIKIVELKLKGDYVYGKAKVLNNPDGERLKVLIDEGIKIDISSRGVGSVGRNGLVEEFKLITYDLVSKASNPGSHLVGIVEGQNYMLTESGDIVEVKCGCPLAESEDKVKSESEETVIEDKITEGATETVVDETLNETELLKEEFDPKQVQMTLVDEFKKLFK